MFRDLDAGADHARRDLLGLRDPDGRHSRPRSPSASSRRSSRSAARRLAVAAARPRPERVRSWRSWSAVGVRAVPAASSASTRGARPFAATRGHPAADRRRRAQRLLLGGLPTRRALRRSRTRLGDRGLPSAACCSTPFCRRQALRVGYAIFFWSNVALVASSLLYLPRSQAPAHRHRVLQRRTCASSSRAASCPSSTSRPRRRTFGVQDDRGPGVEGPARRVHLHRVRALPGGMPGVGHRQAAQPQDDDHGHPRDGGRGRGTACRSSRLRSCRRRPGRPAPADALASRSSTPRSRTTRCGTASPAARASRRAR